MGIIRVVWLKFVFLEKNKIKTCVCEASLKVVVLQKHKFNSCF